MDLDGFVAPGHVSMVLGETPLEFVAGQYKKPIVISGFEPLDILQSIWMLLKQICEQRHELENQYKRVVQKDGNPAGLQAMAEVFELREYFQWRGLGAIKQSGIRIRDKYARYDAERKFPLPGLIVADPENCECGEVLKGSIKPWQCKVFGKSCTPRTPLGALMVSSEGACAAYYNYADLPREDKDSLTN
jgi:hydrogenase expression/formation protein HypD